MTDKTVVGALTIEALQARIAELEAERDDHGDDVAQVTARAERAEADLAAARADTKRLDWLDQNPREATIRIGSDIKACVFYGVSCDPKWSAREAIDAALAGKDAP